MPGPIRRANPSIAYFHRLLDKVVEVLERVFEPLDFAQRTGEMHPEFEEGVAEADRHAEIGGEPADPLRRLPYGAHDR